MNEENSNSVDKNTEWQAPQPPIYNEPAPDLPQMSAMATLGNVFFDPGAVFEDLRKKPFPRLIFPLILCAVLLTVYTVSLNTKIGSEGIVREQMKSPWMAQVPEETKQKMLDEAKKTSPVKTILTSSISGVSMVIVLAIN